MDIGPTASQRRANQRDLKALKEEGRVKWKRREVAVMIPVVKETVRKRGGTTKRFMKRTGIVERDIVDCGEMGGGVLRLKRSG